MADDKLAKLLKTQKSLTEWLEDIRHTDTALIRNEDNEKRERLGELNKIIGIPFDKPVQFAAKDLTDNNTIFQQYLMQHGDELCALRLIPTEQGLPKLRMRGKTTIDAYAWFKEQAVDPKKYKADFVPHPPDYSWATIFIVNSHGIQGEIIYGGHHQLTQGFHDNHPPIVFRFDYHTWRLSPQNPEALAYLKTLVKYIEVLDDTIQKKLTGKFGSQFHHNYLAGYFETSDSTLGTWFIDYNQSLGEMYKDLIINLSEMPQALLNGRSGSSGKATGQVRIINQDQIADDFPRGSILVCKVTTPSYVPIMQKAAAIVTDQGGILSHAAIIARELKKPCVVGTRNATSILENGQIVTVDANSGTVSSN